MWPFKQKPQPDYQIYLQNIFVALIQIYGELNRMRLIMGENSFRGKKIEEYDKQNFKYQPYFGSEMEYEAFKAMKMKQVNPNQGLEDSVSA